MPNAGNKWYCCAASHLALRFFYLKFLVEIAMRGRFGGGRPFGAALIRMICRGGILKVRKLVFLMIIFFAGYATAIYTLAPLPDEEQGYLEGGSIAYSGLGSDKVVQSINSGMHKCVGFVMGLAKNAVVRGVEVAKEKVRKRQIDDN